MSDLERRLREAMIAAAERWSAEHQSGWGVSGVSPPGRRPPGTPGKWPASWRGAGRRWPGGRLPGTFASGAGPAEQWMTGLMDGIRRRHRRHVRRMSAASVVAATAILLGVPPAGHALWTGLASPGRPAAGQSAGSRHAVAGSFRAESAGTTRIGCQAESEGALPADWRLTSLQVGPAWFAYAGQQGYVRSVRSRSLPRAVAGTGKLRAGVMITEVAYGATIVLKVNRSAWSYFRFLPAFSSGTSRYSLAGGVTGLTIVACPLGTPAGVNGEVTDFYLGFLIKAGSSAPVSAWTPSTTRSAWLLFTCPGTGCEGK